MCCIDVRWQLGACNAKQGMLLDGGALFFGAVENDTLLAIRFLVKESCFQPALWQHRLMQWIERRST